MVSFALSLLQSLLQDHDTIMEASILDVGHVMALNLQKVERGGCGLTGVGGGTLGQARGTLGGED